jgi:hypothetical protein
MPLRSLRSVQAGMREGRPGLLLLPRQQQRQHRHPHAAAAAAAAAAPEGVGRLPAQPEVAAEATAEVAAEATAAEGQMGAEFFPAELGDAEELAAVVAMQLSRCVV